MILVNDEVYTASVKSLTVDRSAWRHPNGDSFNHPEEIRLRLYFSDPISIRMIMTWFHETHSGMASTFNAVKREITILPTDGSMSDGVRLYGCIPTSIEGDFQSDVHSMMYTGMTVDFVVDYKEFLSSDVSKSIVRDLKIKNLLC